ncbi:dynein light chain 1, axonemal-like [Sinocyclocheilus rhinocerous]|uniref:dynein light chain 1, axonemal-like n=1 Tax=Sinocyclocheilus rhinocerous TaxID=307959 RepID=UPI0007B9F668|nr:PREDICTED: dynein light chain 1, axonemal-like [Sinocyclocheilus rhinocerous]
MAAGWGFRILSLGRNNIKNFNGLEAVGDTLEELWISYNLIEKLKGIHVMKKLKVLYMSNNLVKEWGEFQKLADLPALADIVFVGNPLEEKYSADGNWIEEATKRLPKLKKLDGNPVIKREEDEGEGESYAISLNILKEQNPSIGQQEASVYSGNLVAASDLERRPVEKDAASTNMERHQKKEMGMDWTHPEKGRREHYQKSSRLESSGSQKKRPSEENVEADSDRRTVK